MSSRLERKGSARRSASLCARVYTTYELNAVLLRAGSGRADVEFEGPSGVAK